MGQANFEVVSVQKNQGICIVGFNFEKIVTIEQSEKLGLELSSLDREEEKLVFNLSGLDYLRVEAVNKFIIIQKRRSRVELDIPRFYGLGEQLQIQLRTLTKAFCIYNSLEEALESFK